MVSERMRAVSLSVVITAAAAIACSLLWHIPYVYTVIGLLALSVVGFIVTIDEDLPGGWSPDPLGPKAVYGRLLLAVGTLAALVLVAVLFPAIRAAGGAQ
jgi:hypothetical protein